MNTKNDFSINQGILALIVAFLLSDIFGHWLALPIARGLGFFLGGRVLIPFAKKRNVKYRVVIIRASLAAALALGWTLVLIATRLG